MKKQLSPALAFLLLALIFSGCKSRESSTSETGNTSASGAPVASGSPAPDLNAQIQKVQNDPNIPDAAKANIIAGLRKTTQKGSK